MARRSDHNRDELKEMAIKAGIALIREDGFRNFSTRKVAAAIGYTVGTIYNVFGTYDEFLLHLNAHTLDAWYAAMEKEIKRYKGDKKLHNLGHFYLQYARDNRNIWLTLFEDHALGNRKIPKWYSAKLEKFFGLMENFLGKSAKQNAHVLWASIHGITILALGGKLEITGAKTPVMLVDNLIDHYTNSSS